MSKKIYTCDRESGNIIDEFTFIDDAKKAIVEYEEADKKGGTYTKDFYDVVGR